MNNPPVRTLSADLRDVERYVALRAALTALVQEMREHPNRQEPNWEWADRLAALLTKPEPPR